MSKPEQIDHGWPRGAYEKFLKREHKRLIRRLWKKFKNEDAPTKKQFRGWSY